MVTRLEECNTEEQHSVVHFLWAEGLSGKDVHKEMLPVYSGKCLSCKAVHNWVEKHGKCLTDDKEIEMEVQKWLETTAERLLCSGFRHTGEAIGKIYQCRWRIC